MVTAAALVAPFAVTTGALPPAAGPSTDVAPKAAVQEAEPLNAPQVAPAVPTRRQSPVPSLPMKKTSGPNKRVTFSSAKRAKPALDPLVVNGRALNPLEAKWVRHIAAKVLPALPGSPSEQRAMAARVTWWSLKEGILDVRNPFAYSNCNSSSGDALIGALETCGPNRAWQVGIGAVQVPGKTTAELERTARRAFPHQSVGSILGQAAARAGIAKGSQSFSAIVHSSGSLRQSWLLRSGPVGFVYADQEVTSECLQQSMGWCYGRGWDTTSWYAPTREDANRSMSNLRQLLSRL